MTNEEFTVFLNQHIGDKGIKWKHAAKKLDVPYMTLFQWKKGNYSPPEYVKRGIIMAVRSWE